MDDVGRTDKPEGSVAGEGVLIDALAARFGGTAYAVVQLAQELAQRPEIGNLTVVTRGGSIVHHGLADKCGVAVVALRPRARLELLTRAIWEAYRLPALVKQSNVDAVISVSGMLPRRPDAGLICLLFNPVMYETGGLANRVRRWAAHRSSRWAGYLAAPSSAMAELVSTSVRRECGVVPLGVDHGVFAPATSPGEEILCVADFYAHKRHDLVLDAWQALPSPRPRLRLVGNPNVNPAAFRSTAARVANLKNQGAIVLEHDVSLERLVWAYRQARVFVMPSERESFCMPIVESMACGVPVVARDLLSLRETAGAGAIYVSGDDPEQWASALMSLLNDETSCGRLRCAALKSASRFSWTNAAEQIAAQVRRVARS